ncbi:MAG TPA: ABC transporter substrate-binding protein [Caldilineaceae bacterium]|nr:ABC transporter substrate-binding protein [Caldilineaceae bacterium]
MKITNKLSRRRLLQGMGAGAGLLALAACTPVAPGAAPAVGDSVAAPSVEGQTILLWSSYSGKNGEAEQALVDRFNEQFAGDVQVDYQVQGSYEETAQAVTRALSAQDAPDVALMSDVWWFKFYLNQTLLPLDDLAAAEDIDFSDYQDPLIEEGFRNGSHWWIPFARSTPLFYYNKEQWAAAGLPERGPETWDEFAEWAPSLVQQEGDEMQVAAFSHPDGASYIAWLFQGVTWQFNGAYSDPDFTMRLTDEETVAAGQFYADSVHTLGWARPSKDIGADFLNGLTAAAMMSTGSMGGLRENATFEFGTALLPKKEQFGCCTGGAGLGILNTTAAEKQAAAMRYIGFVSNPESTAFWSQQTGYMPVRKSAAEGGAMTAYYEEFPQFKTAVDQLPLTRPQDSARVWVPNGDQIIGKGLERITVLAEDVATVFAEVNETLIAEAAPVVETLQTIEG